jgi:thiamine-monophosphate kinase
VILAELRETQIVERIRRRLPRGDAEEVGPGDDAAIVRARGDRLVITVDTQREGSHFRRDWLDAQQLGRRALAVSVSDVVAMGATPQCAVCSLVLPPETEVEWFERLVDGLADAGRELECPVVGGDVSRSGNGVSICVTAVGFLRAGEAPVRRDGACPGDLCAIVGPLGWAAAGREYLGRSAVPLSAAGRACVDAYRLPQPVPGLGRALAPYANAMMDISDGLSFDLSRLCQASGVGALIEVERLGDPILDDAGVELGLDPILWQLGGGDDYALLVAVAPSRESGLREIAEAHGAAARVVGRFDAGGELRLVAADGTREPLVASGWDPFGGGDD